MIPTKKEIYEKIMFESQVNASKGVHQRSQYRWIDNPYVDNQHIQTDLTEQNGDKIMIIRPDLSIYEK